VEELLDALEDDSLFDTLSVKESSEMEGVLAIGDTPKHYQQKRRVTLSP